MTASRPFRGRRPARAAEPRPFRPAVEILESRLAPALGALPQTFTDPAPAASGDTFGISVAAVGNNVLVGALGKNSFQGAAYLFEGIRPPTITSAAGTTFIQGTAGSFTITTTPGTPAATITESGALPAGVTFQDNGNGTATLAGTPTRSGTFALTLTASNGAVPDAVQAFTLVVNPPPVPPVPPPPAGQAAYAVGAGAGALPQVNVYDAATNQLRASFYAFPTFFRGGVRVAVGDVTGDGVPDVICGAGPGAGPQVTIFDGTTFQPVLSFYGMPAFFTGGVFVAAGDVTGTGRAAIIVGADAGAGPQVNVFDGQSAALLESFYAFPASFTGGVRVGAADVNGDGKADIITGAGVGGLPQVSVFSGANLAVLSSFFAFPGAFTGGVFVAGDALGRVIAGAGPGGLPQVSVFDGRTGAAVESFLASSQPSFVLLTSPGGSLGRVHVASAAVSGRVEVLAAPGARAPAQVDVFDAATAPLVDSFFAFGPDFRGGAFVAG